MENPVADSVGEDSETQHHIIEDSSAADDSAGEETKSGLRDYWRPSEDEKLRELVDQYGAKNWNQIAEKMALKGRSGKSCRLRWINQLDPKINRRPFTREEEAVLLAAHEVHGNKWAMISRFLPGRTDNAVKNHFYLVMARRQRMHSKRYGRKRSFEQFLNNNSVSHQRANPRELLSRSRIGLENGFWNYYDNEREFNTTNIPSGGFGGSTLPNLPNYNTVPFPTCFGNLDSSGDADGGINRDTVSFSDSSSTPTNLRASSIEHEQAEAEESSSNVEKNEVPFFDFLGVGVSTP